MTVHHIHREGMPYVLASSQDTEEGTGLEDLLTGLEELIDDFPAVRYLTQPLKEQVAKLLAGEPIACCSCGVTEDTGQAIDREARWSSGEAELDAWCRCRTCGGPQCDSCTVGGVSCGNDH